MRACVRACVRVCVCVCVCLFVCVCARARVLVLVGVKPVQIIDCLNLTPTYLFNRTNILSVTTACLQSPSHDRESDIK